MSDAAATALVLLCGVPLCALSMWTCFAIADAGLRLVSAIQRWRRVRRYPVLALLNSNSVVLESDVTDLFGRGSHAHQLWLIEHRRNSYSCNSSSSS
jgi:hypothetical protein